MATKQNPIALAKKLATKVGKEADSLCKANAALTAFISVPTGLLGGYKMMQKLKKQARLQADLIKVLRAREAVFKELSEQNVVETK